MSYHKSVLLVGAMWAALFCLPSCNVKNLSTQHARQIVGDWSLSEALFGDEATSVEDGLGLRFLSDGTLKVKGADGRISEGSYKLLNSKLWLDDGPATQIKEELTIIKLNDSTLELKMTYESKEVTLRFARSSSVFQ